MPEAVIVDAIRTPIGRAGKGSLKSVRADDLAAVPLKAIVERNPQLDPKSIVDVMMGCANAEGEASRFRQVLVEYNKAPQVTRDRLYLDMVQQILASTSKVLSVTLRSQRSIEPM